MDALDLTAILSFAALVICWALLPSGSRRAEGETDAHTALNLTPVQENR